MPSTGSAAGGTIFARAIPVAWKERSMRILVTGATGVSAAGWFRCCAPWVTTSAALHARLWREPNWIAMAPKQSISALAVSYLIGIAVCSRKMIEPDHAAR